MPLTREQLLSKKNIRIEEVEVPEWDDTVFVKELTAAERDEFEGSMLRLNRKGRVQGTNLVNVRARLAVLTLCDEHGQRMFSDGDVAVLGEMSAAALDHVFATAQRLSGITDQDIDELEKNSVSGPTGASSSS